MVPILALWMPILVAAVLVFIVSSVIHTVLKYHQTDFAAFPSEDEVGDALRPFAVPPGDYVIPHAGSMEALKTPEYKEKAEAGPVAFVSMMPNGVPGMGKSLGQWFAYSLVVGVFTAYITGRAVGPGAEYLTVFQFAGATAFIGYALALVQNSIWYYRKWSTTLKSVFDGFVYALVTAGAFGWLWPS